MAGIGLEISSQFQDKTYGMPLRYFLVPREETACTVGFPSSRSPWQSAFKTFVALELREIWSGKGYNIVGNMMANIIL